MEKFPFRPDISSALRWADKLLSENQIENHLRKAEWLLEYITGFKRAQLYLEKNKTLKTSEAKKYYSLILKASQGVPVQYLSGEVFFYGIKLAVSRRVFIPRPETELLVEKTLGVLKKKKSRAVVYDLCSGSGAISVAVGINSDSIVYGTDISKEAVKYSRLNAEEHNLKHRTIFYHGDFYKPLIENKIPPPDVIVSNPPYIAESNPEDADSFVIQYEPKGTLWGGKDGADFYHRIFRGAAGLIRKDGAILVEIGYNQARKVLKIAEKNGFKRISIYKDYSGKDRIVHVEKNEK
ncbi:MAG: peptide chain release factor N(5)-glutamine methyltransferase [Candidatus Auribacterota bacterium]|nr:peptide chain release factor N(5)-glutamine methyltransferase [Candidatus Auribacterota bacterium]